MPWKDGYTISDERSLADADLRWPDGNRCCVSVVVDLSVAAGPEGIRAGDLKSDPAQFGAHDGLDQLLAVLRRFDMKATFAVPAVMAPIHAERIRALIDEGHEIAAHGYTQDQLQVYMTPAEERAAIRRSLDVIEGATGMRPRG